MKNGDNLPISECVAGWRYMARAASIPDLRDARPEDRQAALLDLARSGYHVWDPHRTKPDDGPADPDAPTWTRLAGHLDAARGAADNRDRQTAARELDAALRLLRPGQRRSG